MKIFLFVVSLASAGWPAGAQTPDSLLAADAALGRAVRLTGLDRALRPVLLPTAHLLYPGAPLVSGPASIRALLEAQPVLDSVTVAWSPTDGWVSAAGDFGVSYGTLVATLMRPGGGDTRPGSYIAAWRHQGDRWRLAALMLAGVVPSNRLVMPVGLSTAEPDPVTPSGPAGPMAQADLDFAHLALRAGAPEAFRSFAAPEAILTGGGPPRRGPDAIGASVAAGEPSDWLWFPVVAEASAAGDLGFTIGLSTITPRAGGAPSYGKYLTVWRRLPDGRIRFLTDGGTARPRP
jgi:ketosteroid isomerase-like protein